MSGIRILVDADACPVKDEIYKVALRHGVGVVIVSNSFMRIMDHPLVSRVIVEAGPDAADDWIAEQAGPHTVVVTADIPLADRALKAGAAALSPAGKPFTDASIGSALAVRAIMEGIRATGEQIGGAPPFSRQDRQRFLTALDAALVKLKRV